jgi:type IV pilus assembly protein PilC
VIRAGETSSKLPESFADLRNYLEWLDQIIADVRQASLYPAIVFSVVSLFVLLLFTFVIPRFAELLHSVNVPLPLLTTVIFGVSAFVRLTWWIWFPLLLFGTIGVAVGRRVSPGFAFATDQLKLALPVFGELNRMLAISRFTHNLALLYRAGITILNSLSLCQGVVGNKVVERAIARVVEDVKGGAIVSEALRRHPVFPALLLRMTVMGETTGNLDAALENVSSYYNDVIPRRIKKMFTILEPALMLFLIILVGCVALAIYLPILSLMGNIK